MDRGKPKHPRHIHIRHPGEEEAPARRGVDFLRHATIRPVGRPFPLVVLLAMIVVLGGLVVSTVLRQAGDGPAEARPAAGATFGPLAPSGEAGRSGLAFAWMGHPRARGYELVLEDAEGRTVWTARVGDATRVVMPADVAASLLPGRPYLWRVVALLPGGESEESRPLAFVPR